MSHSFWTWFTRSSAYHQRPNVRRQLIVELLESRDLLSGFHPNYILHANAGGASPFNTSGPTGTTPAQIRQAYGFNQITLANGVTADGAGTTIAIVDSYDDPNIAGDLHQFDVRFGLADPVFTKVNQSGGSTMPTADSGWASEIALDVEWAHAIAPGAKILLVEAADNSYSNLFTAVRYAASQPGVVAVSMSWGGGEFSSETSYDSTFQTPAGHAGVTFVVSSGDAGAPASYPATSPNVLAVGGTTLNINTLAETGWNGSGGGVSAYESQPTFQNGVVTQSSTRRTSPDVSYDADPNTGFPVYDSYNNGTGAPWSQFGGTSDAAPQWAALIAIADQGRMQAGLGSLDGRTQTLPKIYALPAADFRDITSGTSTGSPNLTAGPGYDLVTGRGSPIAYKIVADLIGSTSTTPSATHFSITALPTTSVAGNAVTFTVTALDATNAVVLGYAGTVHLTSSDGQAVLPANYPFTVGDLGRHSFTVTLMTAGSESISVADTGNSGIVGSANDAVTPAAANRLAFVQQPSGAVAGAVLSPAVSVRVLDAFGNLVSSDNTDQVTLGFGANAGSGTLGGATTATVSAGIAAFPSLSINNPGNGYTLIARSGSLASVTSAAFNISAAGGGGGGGTGVVIENFETSSMWNIANGRTATAVIGAYAAHDGPYGLDQYNGNDWIYRTDAGAQLHAGDTASVWLQFANSANGRAYFGFGASSGGTLSLVAAANTGQLILQSNVNFGFRTLAAVNQTFQANHWYRLEVSWSTSGAILGKLFDSNGTTLLTQVSAATNDIRSGGIAFRATGSDKYWDTVSAVYGVNTFARARVAAVRPDAYPARIDNMAPGAGWFSNLESWLAQWQTNNDPVFTADHGSWPTHRRPGLFDGF